MSDETPRLKLAQLVSLQELNAVTWNEALAQLDALVDLCLNGQFVNDPPASPSDGDAYLVGGAPSGAWSGYAYKIAACLDGAWRFYVPFNGLRAFVGSTNTFIVYLNGAWTNFVNTLLNIPNSALANPQVTIAGHTVALGGSQALAAADLTNGVIGSGAVVLSSQLGAASGVATLDSSGHLTGSQLPSSVVGALNYQGTWNAATNTPALASDTGSKGYYYVVATAGTTALNGIATWNVGDWAVFNGTAWNKLDGVSSEVLSVAGRTGAVTLSAADVSGLAASATTDATNAANISSGTLAAARLPAATASVLGAVKPDGTSILNAAGAISVTPASVGALALAGGTLTGGVQTPQLGIGTAVDANNPLSVYGTNALFNSGGDFRVKLNKAAAANTASFLFQDGFSGRAEIGLCGDDNFHFKVSPDGSTWYDALVIAAATGAVTAGYGLAFPSGAITSSGYLGIGTASPSTPIHISRNGNSNFVDMMVQNTDTGTSDSNQARIRLKTSSDTTGVVFGKTVSSSASFHGNAYFWNAENSGFMFATNATERMRLQASGGLSFGTSYLGVDPGANNVIVQGTMGVGTSSPVSGATLDVAGNIYPHTDNAYALGSASFRFSTVYAGTGSINTSAASAKTGVRGLSDAEIAVAKALAAKVCLFQFVDAVAAKGADKARLHAGMIYEEVVAAFAAQGLDPTRYGIVCKDAAMKTVVTATETVEVLDLSGSPVVDPATSNAKMVEVVRTGTVADTDESGAPRYVFGLRYDELAQFVFAGLAARLAALEAAKAA